MNTNKLNEMKRQFTKKGELALVHSATEEVYTVDQEEGIHYLTYVDGTGNVQTRRFGNIESAIAELAEEIGDNPEFEIVEY